VAADPAATAARWSDITGHPLVDAGDGRFEVPLDDGILRFVSSDDGRGDGVAAFHVAVSDPDAVIEAARARGLATGSDHVVAAGVRIVLVAE